MQIDTGIIFETLAVLDRRNPEEIREHIRGLAIYVSERSGLEDLAALAGGESARNELNPARDVLLQRAANAADWLSRTEDPMNVAKAGHLTLTMAEQALRLWLEDQMRQVGAEPTNDD